MIAGSYCSFFNISVCENYANAQYIEELGNLGPRLLSQCSRIMVEMIS